MTIRRWVFPLMLVTLTALPGMSDTLAVDSTVTPDRALYDYSYDFWITGAGANIDNVFLGSNDLSPLDVVLEVDGNPTSDWSWLGNDTPENYLQFFDTSGIVLVNGDVLDVTSSSAFTPTAEFAVGMDSSTGDTTNTLTGILGPSIATPAPGALPLLALGIALLFVARRRYTARVSQWLEPSGYSR